MLKEYVPVKTKIVDRRNENGGYYIAICDNCGTEFYPDNGNAKFCTPNCTLMSWRKRKVKGEIPSKKSSIKKKLILLKEKIYKGKDLRIFLKQERKAPMSHTKKFCDALTPGETKVFFDDVKIKRISPNKFSLV